MKKLNLIREVDNLLHTLNDILSPDANFIGCFSDSVHGNGFGLTSKMYKGLINFLDSRTDREFDKEGVSRLLESHGFEVIDMTAINGLTYFRTRNIKRIETVTKEFEITGVS
jgi:hypothetical protein